VSLEEEKMTATTQQIWTDFSYGLKQFIIRRIPDAADAEDILQDVFHKIHRNIDSLKADNKLQAWVYQITRNAIIDYYRRQKVMVELPETLAEPMDEAETHDIAACCLKPMIDSLPEKYRQALVLTEFEGLSQKTMAETLGISFSGAKSRVQRARQQIKEQLLNCCHLEFDRLGHVVDYQPREPDPGYPERKC
jgi:RNA polymerase sigma-70 factor (ECF subfamily)